MIIRCGFREHESSSADGKSKYKKFKHLHIVQASADDTKTVANPGDNDKLKQKE
jgi:hypothetical protein